MRGLLGTELLDGPHEVGTLLRPQRAARPVRADDLPGFLAEVEWLCQVWGGGGQPIIPVTDGAMPACYAGLLSTEQIDMVGGLQDLPVVLPRRVKKQAPWDYPVVIIASERPRRDWQRSVIVAELAEEDPWRPIYAAVLGVLPHTPDPGLSRRTFLPETMQFDDIFPVDRQSAAGSLKDLLSRLDDHSQIHPRQLSTMQLACGLFPDSGYHGASNVLPQPSATRQAAGPNIIVAVSPGSVADAALLWNLRTAHTDTWTLPIGVPHDALSPEVLAELARPGRSARFGLAGSRVCLTSASLDIAMLREVTARTPQVQAVSYEEVLAFGPAPGRPGSQIAYWQAGRTRISPLDDADKTTLSVAALAHYKPSLVLDVTVPDFPLPDDPTMRGTVLSSSFQAGAAQVPVSELRRRDSVEVAWPPGWTCLAAVAQSRGLRVTESEAGKAAAPCLGRSDRSTLCSGLLTGRWWSCSTGSPSAAACHGGRSGGSRPPNNSETSALIPTS